MLILGLLLIALGALAIIVAVFNASGTVEVLGNDLTAVTVFLGGVAAGAAILWGFGILKYGTKRSMERRRENRKLTELAQKLDRVENERRDDDGNDSVKL